MQTVPLCRSGATRLPAALTWYEEREQGEQGKLVQDLN